MKKIFTLIVLCCLSFISGYSQNTTILFENFSTASGTEPPQDWLNIQYYTTSVATDSWHFDNPGSRSPGGNFSGNFAIFDSDQYSYNNVFESVGLESKPFNTTGHDTVYAVFDYYFYAVGQTATPNCYFEAYNGDKWELVKQYNSSVSATLDSVNVSKYIRNLCGAKLRFRWESNSGGHFAFDNFKVTSPTPAKANNIDVVHIYKPTPQLCANAESPIIIRFRNAGIASQNSVPFRAELFDGNTTQVSAFTVTGNLRVCLDTIVTFPNTLDISYDSTYSLTVFSQLSNDQTSINSDTLRFEVLENTISPEFLDDFDTTFCGLNNNLTDAVSVNSNETAFWFDDSTLNNEIRRGTTYPLGNVSQDTTIYVQKATVSILKYPEQNLGPNVGYNTINSGAFLYIVAKNDIYIDSLEVEGRSGTNYGYEIYTRKGEYISYVNTSQGWNKVYSDTISYTTNTTTKVYIGSQFISEGDTLSFYIFNTTANTLEFTGGAPITGGNFHMDYHASYVNPTTLFSTGLSGFGYGGSIYYSIVCRSNIAKRSFKPIEYPKGVEIKPSTPFNGFSQNNRDVGIVGDTFTYEITPPDGYTNSEFGSKWSITALTVLTSTGNPIPPADTTILSFPSSQGNGKLMYIPSTGYTDSTIIFRITIKNLDIFPYCEKEFSKNVFIAPVPVVNFSTSASTCHGKSTNFSNLSTISSGNLFYKWHFGNGDSTTALNPNYTYPATGSYQVKLTATSNLGYSRDTTIQITILESPVPNFIVDNVCQLLTTEFTNQTTFTGGAFNSFWTFGDGNNSTDENPSHLYSTAQLFSVKLVVSVSNGCMDSITKNTTVYPRPVAGFNESSNSVCIDININFNNTTTISSGNHSSFWTFGDGNSSTVRNPIHKYNLSGIYQVKLLTSTNFGCEDSVTKTITIEASPVSNFTVANSCDGEASVFNNTTSFPSGTYSSLWTFGDGNSSTVQSPSHLYTNTQQYTVKLVVTGNNGCKDSITKNTTMHPRPVAGYFESTNNICAHTDVSFFNSTTISVGSYTSTWTFGDGNSSTVRNPIHKFNATGAYQVKLLATSNPFGCADSVTKTITIIASPETNFDVSKACDVLNTECKNKTIIPDGYTASYIWNLDGQATSTEMNPKHSFGSTGLKTISLEVTLSNGCKTSMSKQIDFKTGARPAFSNNNFCGNEQASFVNNSVSNASPGDITYRWNLGDGTIINTPNTLLHTYNNSTGMFYEVKLMTSVSGECHDTLTKMVYSGEVAVCDFQIVPTYIPGHRGYQYVPDSTHYASYKWNFGDQKSSTDVSPLHQYSADGDYTVKLEANSADNCKCELTFNHQVINLNVSEFNTYHGLALYPNPTTGLLNIKILEQSLTLTSVKVMDMTGKIVTVVTENQFKDMETFELNVSHLSSGAYQVLFTSQFGQTAKRFVLVK